jgi:1-acyl-sn-glycerol-3-phosphate acyltransferase
MNHKITLTIILRSFIFYLGYAPLTILAAIFTIITSAIIPFKIRHRITAGLWGNIVMKWLAISCNTRYEVIGRENIPATPCVVLCKHQSGWETAFLQTLLTPQTTVLKKELFWIPFFGWALALSNPIGINRGKARAALKQLIDQGTERLKQGIWVLLFPEGTRVDAGKQKPYQKGGAMLAAHSGFDILPIAHNAGLFWPAHRFIKYPGVIKVVIGKPISSLEHNHKTDVLHDLSSQWIETTSTSLL